MIKWIMVMLMDPSRVTEGKESEDTGEAMKTSGVGIRRGVGEDDNDNTKVNFATAMVSLCAAFHDLIRQS